MIQKVPFVALGNDEDITGLRRGGAKGWALDPTYEFNEGADYHFTIETPKGKTYILYLTVEQLQAALEDTKRWDHKRAAPKPAGTPGCPRVNCSTDDCDQTVGPDDCRFHRQPRTACGAKGGLGLDGPAFDGCHYSEHFADIAGWCMDLEPYE